MKPFKKRLILIIAAVLMFSLPLQYQAFATVSTTKTDLFSIQWEGKKVSMPHLIDPERVGQTMMVPVKDTFDALGATVTYTAANKTIQIKKGTLSATFVIGQSTFTINGKKLSMDEKAVVKKQRAMVPAHVLEQIFGVKMVLENHVLKMTASPKEAFRVATLNGPTGVAMAQLIDNNYLGENANLSYEVLANPQLLPTKLIKGEVDIAFMPTNMASIVYNKSKGQVVLVSTDIWGLLSVVTTDPTVKSWSDLKGKQIDIFGQGSTPEIAFKALLESNGLDPKKDVTYKFAYDAPATLATALAGNQLKDGVAVLAEPFTTLAQTKNKDVRVLYEFKDEWKKANGGLGFPMSSIVVRKAFLKEHPELVRSFLREFKNDIAFMNSNPKAVGVIADRQPELQFASSLLEAAIPRSDYKYQTAQEAKPSIVQYLKVLFNFDPQTVGGKLPEEDFYESVQMDY